MASIIRFPKLPREVAPVVPARPMLAAKAAPTVKCNRFFSGLGKVVWIAVVLLSPVLEKILSIDVFFQFIRVLYYWNTPSVHAGWTFLLHFGVLTALTCYVAFCQPKGF